MPLIALCAKGILPCLALSMPSLAAAAAEDDIAELKLGIQSLDEQNRALTKRLQILEAEKAARSELPQRDTAPQGAKDEGQPKKDESVEGIEQRVKELEIAKTAHEDAVRSIIRGYFSKAGSKINEFVTFGGAFDMITGRSKDFSGQSTSTLKLNTAELDFEIQVNEWTFGTVVFSFVDGTDATFPTTSGFQTGVERFNLDRGWVNLGDPQRFPLFLSAGRLALPFGTSTGVHRADVLSIENPLTIEVFETKKTAIGLNFGFPTPAPRPATPGVVVPPVRPLVLRPFITSLSKLLGYHPRPKRPKPLSPITPPPEPPPFYGSIHLYEGNAFGSVKRSFVDNINTRVGYRTFGHCGRRYDQLSRTGLCPWSLDVSVDYNTSIFESQFHQTQYRAFLDRIEYVPGIAASVKSTLGPASLVAEWNGAIRRVAFLDDAAKNVRIRPAAWQLSLGYQFDWNPWIETIGAQGTFVSVSYSQSRDLAGMTRVFNEETSRVGFVPKMRLLLTAGEWVTDGVKVLVEYSRNWDYSINEGGTGSTANGFFTTLTYTW
jgi:hypothetical protein